MHWENTGENRLGTASESPVLQQVKKLSIREMADTTGYSPPRYAAFRHFIDNQKRVILVKL
ncbi:hypothetical protein KATP_14530 [Kluyvera ascorbata]|nr:hypothetical protein KATP_14530 [Kluyvera ascorbata]